VISASTAIAADAYSPASRSSKVSAMESQSS